MSPTQELEGSMLAVLHSIDADAADATKAGKGQQSQQQLQLSNVAGFVCVVQMDVEQDTMIVLSPCPGALPSNVLLVGSLKWDQTKR